MEEVWEILEKVSGPVGTMALLVIVWKGGGLARWVKTSIQHLTRSVDDIQVAFRDFREENRDEHKGLHQRVDNILRDRHNGEVPLRDKVQPTTR